MLMLYDLTTARPHFCTHQEILMRTQCVTIPELTGAIRSMYSIDDQCRIELLGQAGFSDEHVPLWQYRVTMPVMCLTDCAAARTEVTFTVSLSAPLTEEKLRYGCLLQADCLVCPYSAVQTAQGTYRITYDAHITLYLSCHACCS